MTALPKNFEADGLRHETLRIAGERVDNPRRIDVHYPWDNRVIGSVPKATEADVARAFEVAAAFRSPLSRHERGAILQRTARILVERTAEVSDLITLESGLSKKDSVYEVGRAHDVFMLAGQAALNDDGQIFSCDISPHGKKRRIYTQRDPCARSRPSRPSTIR